MRAYRVFQNQNSIQGRLVDMPVEELTSGGVLIRTQYSGVNYKDALAGTGKGRILKKFPLNAGIDAAGIIETSLDPRFQPGDPVILTGNDTGEKFDGGFAEFVRAQADSVIPCPSGLTTRDAMILGTAGFTAGLALLRMQTNGQRPEQGPIVVTGASGGVGSFAVWLFAHAGFEVLAVSGKANSHAFLKSLGAHEVLTVDELQLGTRPLEAGRFGGVVDNVGGELLSRLLPHVKLWGNVASIGLAGGSDLHTTVMPFILRGVSLLGTSSNNCPPSMRRKIWENWAGPWKIDRLSEFVSHEITLDGLDDAFHSLLDRKNQGRILVKVES